MRRKARAAREKARDFSRARRRPGAARCALLRRGLGAPAHSAPEEAAHADRGAVAGATTLGKNSYRVALNAAGVGARKALRRASSDRGRGARAGAARAA